LSLVHHFIICICCSVYEYRQFNAVALLSPHRDTINE